MTTATSLDRGQPEGAADDAIVARDLVIRYGSFEAVRAVSFTIKRGEFFALLGTNGAGKSTTMETLEGMRKRSEGQLRVLGFDPSEAGIDIRSRTGIVLQEAGLADDLNVAETMQLWLKLAPQPLSADDRASRVGQVLKDVGLSSRAETRVKQLSGGQRRRLDIALAIVTEPELLFLDEPTTGLDPESRDRVWQLLTGIHKRGTTVVLTTHYLEEAEAYAERIAIMHAGTIARMGTAAELVADEPASIRFTVSPAVPLGRLQAILADTPIETDERGSRREVCITTSDMQADLYRTLAWADTEGIALQRLRASDASLADIFRSISEGVPA